jgi:hypothetical protein
MKTLNDIRTEYKLSAPKSTRTKVALNFSKFPKTACVIPAGTELQVYFSEVRPNRFYFEYNGAIRTATIARAHKFFTGFRKCPRLRTVEKTESERGGCYTCTGKFVEPDGFGPDGSPSWLLVMGII